MTIRMRTSRVAWWYSNPSINYSPRDFIRYVIFHLTLLRFQWLLCHMLQSHCQN